MRSLLDRLVSWALASCLGAMVIIVFVSVVFRYFLNNPLIWTDELASLLFAWLTFAGTYLASRSRSHIAVDTLVIFLPRAVRAALRQCVDVCIVLLLAVVCWQGIKMVILVWSVKLPAMKISRGYFYLSLPIGAFLMLAAMLQSWIVPFNTASEKESLS